MVFFYIRLKLEFPIITKYFTGSKMGKSFQKYYLNNILNDESVGKRLIFLLVTWKSPILYFSGTPLSNELNANKQYY